MEAHFTADVMLLIMCHAGANRYAIDARHASEVVPRLNLQCLSGAPTWLAGLLICRGAVIPVVDLVQWIEGRPCPNRFSSRIVVLRTELAGTIRPFGVLAEHVGLREVGDARPATGVEPAGITGLGTVLLDEDGVFQLIDPARFLSQGRQAFLFTSVEGQG